MKPPIPKPPIIIPVTNPSLPGKYYQATYTLSIDVKPVVNPKVIMKNHLNNKKFVIKEDK